MMRRQSSTFSQGFEFRQSGILGLWGKWRLNHPWASCVYRGNTAAEWKYSVVTRKGELKQDQD